MRYKLDLTPKMSALSPPITGAQVSAEMYRAFVAWQPSTWPAVSTLEPQEFADTLKRIFEESILSEIHNVLGDIKQSNGTLNNRGHVVAIALMCALDAISSYGYSDKNVGKFIKRYFPDEYRPHADQIFLLYRLSLIHSWNLFEAALYPDDHRIAVENGTLAFGLLNFFDALVAGSENFLEGLVGDAPLLRHAMKRYEELRATAKT